MGFYTYLWLREYDGTFPAGTPYYVGKGSGDRAFWKWGRRFHVPESKEAIIIQEWPDEASAFKAERFLICMYGRADQGTGCLRNLSDGGENPPSQRGKKHSEKTRRKMSIIVKTKGRTPEHEAHLLAAISVPCSPVTREKIAAYKRGKKFPALSAAMRGRKISREHRINIGLSKRGSIPWNKGKKASSETCAKLKATWAANGKDRIPWWKGKRLSFESIAKRTATRAARYPGYASYRKLRREQ